MKSDETKEKIFDCSAYQRTWRDALDSEDLCFRKGQLGILAHVINLETQLQAAEEQIEEQENQEDSEE